MTMKPVTKKLIVAALVMLCAYGAVIGCLLLQQGGNTGDGSTQENTSVMKQFTTYQDIQDFLGEQAQMSSGAGIGNLTGTPYYGGYDDDDDFAGDDDVAMADEDTNAPTSDDGTAGKDYSTTNVQEEGVDEGDIVKNDGKYAYVVSSDRTKVFVSDVYPAKQGALLSTIAVDGTIMELYLRGDKLCVLGTYGGYEYGYYGEGRGTRYSGTTPAIFFNIYDVTNANSPMLSRNYTMEGGYISSRMIGDFFYLVGSQASYQVQSEQELPAPASQIYYVDEYDYSYTYTSIMTIDTKAKDMAPGIKTMLLGSSGTIYASLDNIYLTAQKVMSWVERKELEVEKVIMPILPQSYQGEVNETLTSDLARSEKLKKVDGIVGEYLLTLTQTKKDEFYSTWRTKLSALDSQIYMECERTSIHRISIGKGNVNFEASGDVPGLILNKYSMDEQGHYFRIATTSGYSTSNQIYVLDMSLDVVGELLDIAPGERIYSARFMGERAYLVTFKTVDPFFVIDLSDPMAPKILGELKIPGYSNYLHPYDANHVIGIGNDADASIDADKVHSDNAVYYTAILGVKISLFDVTDVTKPTEIAKYIIGDRGTCSLAQSDPHAFLFNLKKNLLVIPITLFEIDQSAYPDGAPPGTGGVYTWEGAYVFHISSSDGISLEGRVSHSDEDATFGGSYWYGWSQDAIQRSFYIEDVLYTVSSSKIKASDLQTLKDLNEIDLPNTDSGGGEWHGDV